MILIMICLIILILSIFIIKKILKILLNILYLFWKNIIFIPQNRYLLITIILIICTIKPIKTNPNFFENYYKVTSKKYVWINKSLFKKIYIYSTKYDLNPLLVTSLINAESSGNQYAISCSKARGYMQIMYFHYKGNVVDLYDTDINLNLGCNILYDYRKLANYDLSETLRKYNQGPNADRKKYKNWKYVIKIILHYIIMRIDYLYETC